MPVEKINVSQPVQSVPIVEKQTEYYDKPTPRTSGSNKDVITVLSALAAVGAAGVAVYKHKEAKKLVADAENAAKKQIDEANAKLKKAEEEIEKKIKEAVDKVKEEYEKKTEKTDNIKTKVNSARSYMLKLAEKVRNRFKKDTPKTEKTIKPENPVKKAEKEKTTPVKESEAEKVSLKKRISTYLDETAYVIYSKGINYAKKFKSIMKAKPKEVVEPEIISEAAESEVTEKITLKTKALNVVKKASDFVTEKFRSFRNASGKKPKEVVEPEIISEAAESEVTEKITLKTKAMNVVKNASDFVTEKFRSLRGIFSGKNSVPEEMTEEAAEITNPPLTSEIIVPSHVEKFFDEGAKKGIKIEIENDDLSAKLAKINSDLANAKWLKEQHDIKEQEYQELFNSYFAQKIKNSIKEKLNRKIDYKALIDSSIKEPNSEITHELQQAAYDELGELLVRNVFKGIKIPDVRDISEQNLITEYNALKNVVKNLPAAASASKRFLEIKGELINHRGYYITADGQLIKKSAKEIKSQAIMGIEEFFGSDAKKGVKELEKAESLKAQKEIASQNANAEWLKEQHDIKEREYQKLFDEHFAKQEKDKFFDEGANQGVKIIEGEEAAIQQAKQTSDIRNQLYLSEQHDIKEREYQKLFDEHFVQKEREQFAEDAAKGMRVLEIQQNGKRYARLVSDAKNANWLKEQHDIKEREYQKLFDEHFAKQEKNKFFDEGANQGVKIIEGEEAAIQQAKQTSDIRNQLYLSEQHDIKEREYQKLFDEHFAKQEKDKFFDEGANQGVKIIEEEEAAVQQAKQTSDFCNQSYLSEQHDIKEREYQKLFDEHFEEQSRKVVADLEKKLDGKGNLVAETPRKHNRRYHDKLQKEYDKLAIEQETPQYVNRDMEQIINDANRYSGIRTDGINYTSAAKKQLSVAPDTTYRDSDGGVEIIRNVVRGLNDLPESFNETERLLLQRAYRHTNVPRENVTEYPKLYAGKEERKAAIKGLFSEGFPSIRKLKEFFGIMGEERAVKKAYKKAKAEHIARRTTDYKTHGGVGGAQIAITNPYMVTRDMKFSHKKYASMSKERPTEKDWEVEMTRADFMKDKEKYMLENFEREYQTQMGHSRQ